MSKVLLILLSLCLVQVAIGRRLRDAAPNAPKDEDLADTLLELGRNAQEAFVSFNQKFLETIGFKDPEQAVVAVKDQTVLYVTKLKAIQETLAAEAQKNSGMFDGVVKAFNVKVAEATKKLEEQNPEFYGEAKKYQESVAEGFQSVISEADKLGETFKKEGAVVSVSLEKALEKIYLVTLDTIKKTNTELASKKKN